MKKLTLSAWFIVASIAYAAYLHFTGPEDVPAAKISSAMQQDSSAPALAQDVPATQPPTVSAPPPARSAAAPKPKPSALYTNGTYTGSQADAYYGTVQVKATVQGGTLANVVFLEYPNDRGTSRRINAWAMPMLISEAIQAESANVDIVSGATYTSGAFRESLISAL